MAKKGKSGFAGMSYQDIMMQQAIQKELSAKYCRYCGKDVNTPSDKQPEVNWNQNLEWEQKYQSHWNCHQKHQQMQRGMRY